MTERASKRIGLACAVAVVASLAGSRVARAHDDLGPPELRPLPWTRWAVFDPILDPRSSLLEAGYARAPAAEGTNARGGLRVDFGDGIRTEWDLPFVELERRFALTATRPDALLVQLPCYTMWAGLRAAHAELAIGAGVSIFGVDGLTHGVAFSFLSPSAAARATFTSDNVRVSAVASIEYLWRWFDREDLAVRTISLEISLIQPPSRHLGTHPVLVGPAPSAGSDD